MKYIVLILLAFLYIEPISATAILNSDTTTLSKTNDAIEFMNRVGSLKQSEYWPNVKPASFVENIKKNIFHPLNIYEGAGTDFCSYAAFSYLILHDNPLGYA